MEDVEVDVIPMIYSKEELNNLINIENPKKIKEKFFASFIAKELPPSEDEKKHKIPEGLNDKERGGFCLKLENFPSNFRDNMVYKPLLKQKKIIWEIIILKLIFFMIIIIYIIIVISFQKTFFNIFDVFDAFNFFLIFIF